MKQTTLCYIENEDSYLMMHRIIKKNDANKDKWIGIGGHFEDKESPEECLLREVYEETGLILLDYKLRGIVTFVSDEYPTEYMYLFTSSKFSGSLVDDKGHMKACHEGVLEWVKKKDINKLNLWQGDLIFFDLLEKNVPFFSLKLVYQKDKLVDVKLNGKNYKED